MTDTSPLKFPSALVIDGALRESATGGTIKLTEPATENPLCEVPAAGKTEVEAALVAAERVFREADWQKQTVPRRSGTLLRIAALIRENAERLATIEARNVGKPIEDARWEINAGARCFEYYAGVINAFTGETIPTRNEGFNFTLRIPVGVVAAIVPWNFPFLMACWKVAPALATGNSVVLKPASLTPLSALELGKLALNSGLPRGVLQVLAGPGGEIGDFLVSHSLTRKIAFTGETTTGARIMKLAADDIKRVSLELGGKSPNLIFADADIEAAAEAAPLSVFANTGQDCCARSRMLVEQSVYDRFVEAFVAATQKIVVGDPLQNSTQVGPMVSAGQRRHVESYIDLAKSEGGRVLTGGKQPHSTGWYLDLTIIDRLPNQSRVCQEEIFGPVACVIPFKDEAEAVRLANDSLYGLSGSIWTRDVERALRVARNVETGVLSVNTNSSVYQEAPFGGFKRSGFGRDLGMEAMRLYTETRNVFVRVPGF